MSLDILNVRVHQNIWDENQQRIVLTVIQIWAFLSLGEEFADRFTV
jgi:hypothetical protein